MHALEIVVKMSVRGRVIEIKIEETIGLLEGGPLNCIGIIWDFNNWPLNRGWPFNTRSLYRGSIVIGEYLDLCMI
jgi:hypothetical protein